MLDMRRLRLLREVQLRGTLAEVAEALAFSPSSVSQQLAQLEREAGVKLLQKSGRRVQLTPQGELLATRAAQLLDGLEQAEAELATSLDAVVGTVRVAVFQSAAHAVIPTALSLLRDEHPQLRVEIVEREPEEGLFDLAARDFDLVLAEQYPGHTRPHLPDLDREFLATDALRLALPPASVIQSLADAAGLPFVMEPAGTVARLWATQLCRAEGFEPDVRFETADLIAHIRLIETGNAVGMLPDLVWAGREPALRLVDLPGTPSRTVFTSARLVSAARPAVTAVRGALARATGFLVAEPG